MTNPKLMRRPPPPPPNMPPPPVPRKSVRLDPNVIAAQLAAAALEDSSSTAQPVKTISSVSEGGDLKANDTVWYKDDVEVWAVHSVVSVSDTKVVIKKAGAGGKEKTVSVDEVLRTNPKSMSDMTALYHIHEPGILQNLKERNAARSAYTFMASAMIAVNPLRRTEDPRFTEYLDKAVNAVAPHPFSIAESSYQNLSFSGKNQSIIVSGESGAGKTETAKIILKYLAGRNLEGTSSSSGDSLDVKLLKSSPILESFGNAKTLRNNNSSRFGKFMKLLFESTTGGGVSAGKKSRQVLTLSGAQVETYLLEKSRVIRQSEGECNFHIFYQLLISQKDLAEGKLLNLNTAKSSDFKLLSNNNLPLYQAMAADLYDLSTISTAFSTIGLTPAQINGIWRILAGLLHLGNVSFEDLDTPEGTVATISSADAVSCQGLQHAAVALGVEADQLKILLTQREVLTRGELFIKALTKREASYARDATIKAIYESLFSLIVKYVNLSLVNPKEAPATPNKPAKPAKAAPGASSAAAMTPVTKSEAFIGVLDIFGFENFAINEYEQLLINFANEALQNTFNTQIFIKEIELFRSENIDFTISECPNNTQCVELIVGKTNSIFALLDSISRQPKPSDGRFCEELHKAFSNVKYAEYFPAIHRKDMKSNFQIKHFAGVVKYTVDGDKDLSGNSWIAKNNDSIPDGLTALYGTSTLAEFRSLSGDESAGAAGASGKSGDGKRRTSVMLKPTIAAIFSRSMDELNTLLLSTACHFIRCIKPNAQMQPDVFNNQYVVEQLRALGILQACEVLKVCLPTRVSYAELSSALSNIVSKVKHLFTSEPESVLMACILRAYNINADMYKLGRTMVFFRPGQLAQIEGILKSDANNDPAKSAAIINTIQDSLEQSRKALEAVGKTENRFKEVLEIFSELEKKYEKLNNKANNLPPAEKVELPPSLVKKVASIDATLKQVRLKVKEFTTSHSGGETLIKQNEAIIVKNKKLDALTAMSKVVAKSLADLSSAVTDAGTKYSDLTKQIAAVEENSGEISKLFTTTIASNDAIYDAIQDQITECEELTRAAHDDAVRCQLFAAETKSRECDVLIQALHSEIQKLQDGINIANKELDKYQAGSAAVDFTAILSLADQTSAASEACKTSSTSLSTTLTQWKDSIKTASVEAAAAAAPAAAAPAAAATTAGTAGPPPPPPRPSGGVSPTPTEGAAEGAKSDISAIASATNKKIQEFNLKTAAANAAAAAAEAAAKSAESAKEAAATPVTGNFQGLPVGWKEVIDKKTNRPYYVNTITKERQWKRLGGGAAATTSSASGATESGKSTGGRSESGADTPTEQQTVAVSSENELPPHWRELVDKKTNRKYYVNDQTKERQWRRPEPVQETTIKTVDRLSRRISLSPTKTKKAASAAAPTGVASVTANEVERARKVATARRASALLLDAEKVDFFSADESTRHSITFMNRIGRETKRGYLQKQSKFLGRWKKRYVVLSDSKLEYFDKAGDAPGTGKTFELTGYSTTSYTSTENCMCISNSNDRSDEKAWFLLADTESELEAWMTAINAHIHTRYIEENNIETDYWDEGTVELSCWTVPVSTASGTKRPVGIRTLPIVDGPRTGEGIYPGEVVEICQTIEGEKGQRFLRLAGDRGWVFEYHPSGNYAIMAPVSGSLVEVSKVYSYSAEFFENLKIYTSPTCDEEQALEAEEDSFAPGCSEIRGCAEFTPEQPDDEDVFTYVKLEDGRGWVPMHHPVTGGVLLTVVSTSAAPKPAKVKPAAPAPPVKKTTKTASSESTAESVASPSAGVKKVPKAAPSDAATTAESAASPASALKKVAKAAPPTAEPTADGAAAAAGPPAVPKKAPKEAPTASAAAASGDAPKPARRASTMETPASAENKVKAASADVPKPPARRASTLDTASTTSTASGGSSASDATTGTDLQSAISAVKLKSVKPAAAVPSSTAAGAARPPPPPPPNANRKNDL